MPYCQGETYVESSVEIFYGVVCGFLWWLYGGVAIERCWHYLLGDLGTWLSRLNGFLALDEQILSIGQLKENNSNLSLQNIIFLTKQLLFNTNSIYFRQVHKVSKLQEKGTFIKQKKLSSYKYLLNILQRTKLFHTQSVYNNN